MRICVNVVIIAQIAIFEHCGATIRKKILHASGKIII